MLYVIYREMKRWRSEGGSQRLSTIVACCQLSDILWHSSHDANHFVSVCKPLSTHVSRLKFCGKNKASYIHRGRNTLQNYAENVEAPKTDC